MKISLLLTLGSVLFGQCFLLDMAFAKDYESSYKEAALDLRMREKEPLTPTTAPPLTTPRTPAAPVPTTPTLPTGPQFGPVLPPQQTPTRREGIIIIPNPKNKPTTPAVPGIPTGPQFGPVLPGPQFGPAVPQPNAPIQPQRPVGPDFQPRIAPPLPYPNPSIPTGPQFGPVLTPIQPSPYNYPAFGPGIPAEPQVRPNPATPG